MGTEGAMGKLSSLGYKASGHHEAKAKPGFKEQGQSKADGSRANSMLN